MIDRNAIEVVKTTGESSKDTTKFIGSLLFSTEMERSNAVAAHFTDEFMKADVRERVWREIYGEIREDLIRLQPKINELFYHKYGGGLFHPHQVTEFQTDVLKLIAPILAKVL